MAARLARLACRGELTPVDFELLWASLHAWVGAMAGLEPPATSSAT